MSNKIAIISKQINLKSKTLTELMIPDIKKKYLSKVKINYNITEMISIKSYSKGNYLI